MQRSGLCLGLAGGFALVFLTSALVAACGSSGGESLFLDGGFPPGLDATVGGDGDPPPFTDDGGSSEGGPIGPCVPKKCSDLGAECGPQGDGCGGIIQCGDCVAPATCGGGGVPSKCGGTSGCLPKTCADINANCGAQGDGCGKLIAGGCGTCTAPEICGGGGVANKCGAGASGDAGTCVPTKAACAPGDCGPISDGCGNVLNCGGCTAPAICGGGGVPSQCGGGTLPDGGLICTPKTCAQLSANCGPMGDGCGGLANGGSCGTCTSPAICGGGGVPSQCGGGTADAGTCVAPNLCSQQVTCPGSATTTITGTVLAPRDCAGQTCNAVTGLCTGTTCNSKVNAGDADPIFDAVVYIPNGGAAAVKPFTPGVTCDQCGGAGTQAGVLVSAITGADGKFTLTNVPVGNNIPVVVQLGRWRRIFTVNVTNSCGANPVGDLHLPKNKSQGSIPLMALSTGNVDTLECLLRKIGLDDAEFTLPTGTGRVGMYQGNGGDSIGANTLPAESTLTSNPATLANYDMVLFPCWGGEDHPTDRPPQTDQQNIINYTHAGGRMFATHYSYVWLFGGIGPVGSNNFWASEFRPTANWSNGGLADQKPFPTPDPMPSDVDTSFTKGLSFSQWLNNVNALSNVTPPMVDISAPRNDVDTVNAVSQRWIYADAPPSCTSCPATNATNFVEHYTFNTPVGAAPASQCGRVVYSDFHVTGGKSAGTFPTYCGGTKGNNYNHNAPLSPQEKVLEFMLFDLASCVAPDVPPPPPTCNKVTCQQQNIACGPAGDGCGGLIPSCGPPCAGNQTCGGGGVSGQCGGPTCTPKTCQQLGYNCGQAGDGCGGLLPSCGSCQTGQNCGGGGSQNVCGTPVCTAKTCQQLGIACGMTGDGCGNPLDCGPCTAPDTCGGGGTPGQCGHPPCNPTTCQAANANCGPIANGCGGILQCGDCTPPQTCGGGGVANQCGGGIK